MVKKKMPGALTLPHWGKTVPTFPSTAIAQNQGCRRGEEVQTSKGKGWVCHQGPVSLPVSKAVKFGGCSPPQKERYHRARGFWITRFSPSVVRMSRRFGICCFLFRLCSVPNATECRQGHSPATSVKIDQYRPMGSQLFSRAGRIRRGGGEGWLFFM